MPDLPQLARLVAPFDDAASVSAVYAELARGCQALGGSMATLVLSRHDADGFIVEAVAGHTVHHVGDVAAVDTTSRPALHEQADVHVHSVHSLGRVVALVAVVGDEPSEPLTAAIDVLARHAGAHLARLWDAEVRDDLLDERAAAMVALRRNADTDLLTGVASRGALLRMLGSFVERDDHVGVVYVDLDHFKEINDTYGHAAGDRVLRTVATRIREAVRPGDVVGRVGGDEFVVVVREADAVTLQGITNRLERAMETPIELGRASVVVRASAGTAVAGTVETAAAVLRAADTDMYRQKRRHARRLMSIS